MELIRAYDTSASDNDTDRDCSAAKIQPQLLLNQVLCKANYLRFIKNTFHACRHVAQRFTTIGAFSVVEKYLSLDLSLFPMVYINLLLQRSSQKQEKLHIYVLYNG